MSREINESTRLLVGNLDQNGQPDQTSTPDHGPPESGGFLVTKLQIVGTFLAIFSSLMFTVNNFYVKELAVNFADVLIVRSIIQLAIFSLVIKCWKKQPLWPDFSDQPSRSKQIVKLVVLFLQGISVGLVVLCIFLSVQAIPLGDALTLVFSSPLFTMILSAIVLKSHMGLYKITLCITLIAGVIFVVRPPFLFPPMPNPTPAHNRTYFSEVSEQLDQHDSKYFLGVLAGLSGAICCAIVTVLVNFLKDVDFTYLIFYAGIGGLFDSLISSTIDDNCLIFRDPASANWGGLFFVSLLGMSANLLSIKACQLISPPVASILFSLQIVFAYILQSVVMHEVPSDMSIAGATLIIFCAIFVPFEPIVVPRLPGRWTQQIM